MILIGFLVYASFSIVTFVVMQRDIAELNRTDARNFIKILSSLPVGDQRRKRITRCIILIAMGMIAFLIFAIINLIFFVE
jgi:hypothetical protein